MNKIFYVLPLAFVAVSCTTLPRLIYGANRNLKFETRDDVVAYYQKKNDIDANDLYFFDRHEDYLGVMNSDEARLLRDHYGVALNDSVLVDDRQQADRSCVGVSSGAIVAYDTISATTPSPFYKKGLKNIYGQQMNLSRKNPTVIMLVHSNYGRILKKDINYYKSRAKEAGKSFDYVFVVIDVPKQNTEAYFVK